MNFTSQICTTKEQSERLLALGLKKETADMYLELTYSCNFENKQSSEEWEPHLIPYSKLLEDEKFNIPIYFKHIIPAWSLHRLIEMIPTAIPDKSGITHCFIIDGALDISYYYFGEESWENWKSWHQKDLYNNIIDCIEWLIQEKHFSKEYLNQ